MNNKEYERNHYTKEIDCMIQYNIVGDRLHKRLTQKFNMNNEAY